MRKIPTIFFRNFRTRLIQPEARPDMLWTLNTYKAVPTVKWDGMSIMISKGKVHRRFDCMINFVKGTLMTPPLGFIPCEIPDMRTGHWAGWYPINMEDASNDIFKEAVKNYCTDFEIAEDGTYELIGPTVRHNPYKLTIHMLRKHGEDIIDDLDLPTEVDSGKAYEVIRTWFVNHPKVEGIVFYNEDSTRMGKVKRVDYGLAW